MCIVVGDGYHFVPRKGDLFAPQRKNSVLMPKQLRASAAARLCDLPEGPAEIAYGGARGGGKSFWLLAQLAADDCQRLPGLKALFLRKVGKANIEHLSDLRASVLRNLPHEFIPGRGIINFPNGSKIIAGHFQNDRDIDSYLGIEYDVIAVEEATTLSHNKYRQILTCCRSSKQLALATPWLEESKSKSKSKSKTPSPNPALNLDLNLALALNRPHPRTVPWRARAYSTTNPGGVGHAWFKEHFVIPWRAGHETVTRFVPATVDDNPFVQTDYRAKLEALPGWQRKAWLNGDWDIAAGQFFTTWDYRVHVPQLISTADLAYWCGALDYGFSAYTVFLLAFRDKQERLFVMGEYAGRGKLPETNAAGIKQLLAGFGLEPGQLGSIPAGPDPFTRDKAGRSVPLSTGVTVCRSGRRTPSAWQAGPALASALGDPASGVQPKLQKTS